MAVRGERKEYFQVKDTGRRQFLLGSVASLTFSPLQAAAGNEIRTAFVGVGKRGKSLVTQVLRQPSVRIAAICDIDAKARDEAQGMAQRDNPRSFTDYRKLLELKDVDAIIVATPCYLHAEMSAACLNAGKYVYCEKPLGVTPEQVDLVLKAAARSKVFLQIGQQLRYVQTLRDMIRKVQEEKLIGEVFVIKAQRHSTPVPLAAELARPDWYKDVKRSGDLIVENAVHNLDVCNWVAGSRPAIAFGHGKKYFPKPMPAGTLMMDGFSVEYIYRNDVHLELQPALHAPSFAQRVAWRTVVSGVRIRRHSRSHRRYCLPPGRPGAAGTFASGRAGREGKRDG